MPEPHPSVAATRVAVRRCLADDGVDAGSTVIAAVSGGADSLALLAALAHEARRLDVRPVALHVDHQLQAGSAGQAARVADQARSLGVAVVDVTAVDVTPYDGPEGSARRARYAAFEAALGRHGATLLLLGHSRDDQAEQVLLGLARGSGTRSLAGMPSGRDRYRRPLLNLTRATLRTACEVQGLTPYDDPTNSGPELARSRVRHAVLPVLERELGPGVAAALARTAALARDDADLLDALAAQALERCRDPDAPGERLAVVALAAEPPALRGRVVRTWLVDRGCPAGTLGYDHVIAVLRLVTDWNGQRGVALPGGLVALRRCDTLAVDLP